MKDILHFRSKFYRESFEPVLDALIHHQFENQSLKDVIVDTVKSGYVSNFIVDKGFLLSNSDEIVFCWILDTMYYKGVRDLSLLMCKKIENYVYSLPEESENKNISEIREMKRALVDEAVKEYNEYIGICA